MSDLQSGDLLTGGTPEGQPTGTTGNQSPAGSGETAATSGAGNSTEQPKWMDQLEGDLKANKTLYRFKSASDAVKSFVELEGKQGSMISKPGPEATAEEKSRFNAYLSGGVTTPDDYDLSAAKLPDTVKLTDAGVSELRKLAFENGWTMEAAVKAVEWDAQRQAEAVKEARRQTASDKKAGVEALKADWGTDYDANLVRAKQATTKYGSEGLNKLLQESGLGNHPDMVRMMAGIGEATAEGNAPIGGTRPKPTGAAVNFPGAAAMAAEYQGKGA